MKKRRPTGFNKQTSTVDVCGGGCADCLAASDIDRMLTPVIPTERLLPAIRLYRIRTGFETPRDTKLQINAALKTRFLHHCTCIRSSIAVASRGR